MQCPDQQPNGLTQPNLLSFPARSRHHLGNVGLTPSIGLQLLGMHNPFDPGYFSEADLKNFGFRSVGRNVRVAKNCVIIGLENISFGNNVRIDGNTYIVAATGHVTIGSFVHIGAGSYLAGGSGIVMHDFSGLSQGVKIYSASDDYVGGSLTNPTVPKEFLNIKTGEVSLEKHVIIGAGSVILPGITLREGSSVGALSLINKSTKKWSVYFGTPAQKVMNRMSGTPEKEAQLREKYPALC